MYFLPALEKQVRDIDVQFRERVTSFKQDVSFLDIQKFQWKRVRGLLEILVREKQRGDDLFPGPLFVNAAPLLKNGLRDLFKDDQDVDVGVALQELTARGTSIDEDSFKLQVFLFCYGTEKALQGGVRVFLQLGPGWIGEHSYGLAYDASCYLTLRLRMRRSSIGPWIRNQAQGQKAIQEPEWWSLTKSGGRSQDLIF